MKMTSLILNVVQNNHMLSKHILLAYLFIHIYFVHHEHQLENASVYMLSRWNIFAKIVNGYKPLTIFPKSSIVDVLYGPKYISTQPLLPQPST